jgi:hypothetical protein
MRIEEIKKGRKDTKVIKLIDEFIRTGYDKVEVLNEDDYPTNKEMASAIRGVITYKYKDKVKVIRNKERVFLSKIKSTH